MKVTLNYIGHIVMARRKKGKDIHGWLLVDKPAGVTSSHVVNKLRWLLNANKAGHGGTLDPDATGLLPVAFGEATKLLPYLEDAQKTYDFRINWGVQTSTDDASGDQIATSDTRPTIDEVIASLPLFRGDILQIPPQVSAVKVDGQRAYDLAREGVEMELKSRALHVASLEISAFSKDSLDLVMSCGKGGYVRSIARDLGAALGCFGHVEYLRRLSCLGFVVQSAKTFDHLLEHASVDMLVPVANTPLIATLEVNESEAEDLRHGRVVERAEPILCDGIAIAMCGNLPVAIIEITMCGIQVRRGLHIAAETIILT